MDLRPQLILHLFAASVGVQKKRALLTIASIAWGSVALLLLLSFGEGLKRQLGRGSAGMGTNIAVMWPGETSKAWQGLPPGRPVRPRVEDAELLRARVPGLAAVSAQCIRWGATFSIPGKTVNGRVTGVEPIFGEIRNQVVRPGGRFIDEPDIERKRRVTYLGDELAQQIFGAAEPVGQTVLIDGTPFTVIGVMQKKLQMGTYAGPDNGHAVIPISTYVALYGTERVNNFVLRPERPQDMKRVLRDVHVALGARYGFDPTDTKVLPTWDTVEGGKIMRNILVGIEIFLGLVGAMTLMIGGVGVANIMYATVKERTREIGVKMALGARPSWIVAPLVLEGLLYTAVGGAAGMVISVLLVLGIGAIPTGGNEALEFLGKPTLSPAVGLASALVLGAVGLLAAYFPARRAAGIDPASTLRYE